MKKMNYFILYSPLKFHKKLVFAFSINQINNTLNSWEKDIGITVTEEEWSKACKNVFCYVKSPYWQEYAWKLLVRFFLTALKIGKYTNQIQYCWRECGECKVDLVHVLYTSSKIQPYWVNVLEFMKQICGQNINFELTNYMSCLAYSRKV